MKSHFHAFWNHANGSTANIQNFRIFGSSLADFSISSLLGTFINPQQAASNLYPVSVYDLVDSNAQYIRLMVDSYYGNGCCVAVGELAFDVNAAVVNNGVPEPSSMALVGLALFGIVASRKRSA